MQITVNRCENSCKNPHIRKQPRNNHSRGKIINHLVTLFFKKLIRHSWACFQILSPIFLLNPYYYVNFKARKESALKNKKKVPFFSR